ncbi:MAG: excinuclease ABC subunit UvrC [Candidatus Kariarchaeaceae archaeon]
MSSFEIYTKDELSKIPKEPGVYIIRNIKGEVIYIGKANNLQNRLRSHFQESATFSKSQLIQKLGKTIEVIAVSNEKEALLLEFNLIQEHNPPLNDKWTDDKSYPFLEITDEFYPRVLVTRERTAKKSRFYGPYTSKSALKLTIKFLINLFPVADCLYEIKQDLKSKDEDWSKRCFRRRTKQCFGPCWRAVDEKLYQENINKFQQFIKGEIPQLIDELKLKMSEHSQAAEFEQAAKIRDILTSVEKTLSKQSVSSLSLTDCDLIGYFFDEEHELLGVGILRIRNTRVIGSETIVLPSEEKGKKLIATLFEFLDKFYPRNMKSFPIVLSLKNDSADLIEGRIRQPKNNAEKELIQTAEKNAKLAITRNLSLSSEKRDPKPQIINLQEILQLNNLPQKIDGFDVSTLQGTNTVGASVRFTGGYPEKSQYRRFRIKSLDNKHDDFTSMNEIVYRRYAKAENLPDLIVVDGGLGQLNASLKALKALKLEIPIIGLAKKEEIIILPGEKNTISLDKNHPALLLLRQIRDEVHRFAISYHKLLRGKSVQASSLEKIKGIGSKRASLLLQTFGSIDSMKDASSEELANVLRTSSQKALEILKAIKSL